MAKRSLPFRVRRLNAMEQVSRESYNDWDVSDLAEHAAALERELNATMSDAELSKEFEKFAEDNCFTVEELLAMSESEN